MQKFPTLFGSDPQNLHGAIFNSSSVVLFIIGYVQSIEGIFILAF